MGQSNPKMRPIDCVLLTFGEAHLENATGDEIQQERMALETQQRNRSKRRWANLFRRENSLTSYVDDVNTNRCCHALRCKIYFCCQVIFDDFYRLTCLRTSKSKMNTSFNSTSTLAIYAFLSIMNNCLIHNCRFFFKIQWNTLHNIKHLPECNYPFCNKNELQLTRANCGKIIIGRLSSYDIKVNNKTNTYRKETHYKKEIIGKNKWIP